MKDDRTNQNGNGDGIIRNQRGRAWLWRRNGRSRRESVLGLEVRLRELGERVPATQIDELWVFPPLPDRDIASEFIVLSCFGEPGRRRIVTAHVEADSSGSDEEEPVWLQRVQEHGTAPENWVSGIPDRLLERLSDAGVPRVVEIGGEPARWSEAVQRLTQGANGASARNGHVDSAAAPKVISRTPDSPGAKPGP